MIEGRQIGKSFGSLPVLHSVSLEAEDGRVTAVLGSNGAGKTTLLRVLSGMMCPDVGTVSIDRLDMATQPLKARSRLGMLPDSRGLYVRLTPQDHIEYFGRLYGLSRSDLRQRSAYLLDLLDLGPLRDRPVAGFSLGERNKVALARALVHDPQNVILDEPTVGLDVGSIRTVRNLIVHLRGQGRCVIFTSHVMQEVSALCDRVVVISRGRIVADGSIDEIRSAGGSASLEDALVALTSTCEPDVAA